MTVKNQKVSYPPSVVPPSPYEFPNTVQTITGILRNSTTTMTIPNHGFTEANDAGITSISIHQVVGMTQINGLIGMILEVIDTNNIILNINSTNFSPYISGGQAISISGHEPFDPFENIL
jgi:hypothetical protein